MSDKKRESWKLFDPRDYEAVERAVKANGKTPNVPRWAIHREGHWLDWELSRRAAVWHRRKGFPRPIDDTSWRADIEKLGCEFDDQYWPLIKIDLMFSFPKVLDKASFVVKSAPAREWSRQLLSNDPTERFTAHLWLASKWPHMRAKPRPGALYEKYLNSLFWDARREEKLASVGHKCQVDKTGRSCSGPMTVHHSTYERIPYEPLPDMLAACKRHHGLMGKVAV